MPINTENLQTIINNINADVRSGLPELDPSIPGSAIKVITEALAARSFDNRQLIAQLIQQSFPQTAIGEFLELWAEYDGLTRNAATQSSGAITITGTVVATEVPSGALLVSNGEVTIETQAAVLLSSIVTSIVSLNFIGGIVVAFTSSDHNLASGVVATIAGANETEYNGSFEVTVIDENTFTYVPTTAPSITPATGTITSTFIGAVVDVISQDTGLDQNLGAGAVATFSSPIAGVDTSAIVRSDSVDGGTDTESDEDLRVRVLESRAAINSLFSADYLTELAKTVSGVTRVFVKETTLVVTPTVGAVTVYFMRDGDASPIPSGVDITNLNDVLQAVRPANTLESDFLVLAPTEVAVPITLTGISPDTATMRSNIESVLQEFFSEQVDFEADVLVDRIKAALFNAQDTDTGDFLSTFTLSAPAVDVTVVDGSIGTLGAITIT